MIQKVTKICYFLLHCTSNIQIQLCALKKQKYWNQDITISVDSSDHFSTTNPRNWRKVAILTYRKNFLQVTVITMDTDYNEWERLVR